MGMGFWTWGWDSGHEDGVPDSEKFPLQVEGAFDGVGALGVGFKTWGWGSGHGDGVPDMGHGTWDGVPDLEKFPLQVEGTFGDDI